MKKWLVQFICATVIIAAPALARAAVEVNEVMSNEPGSRTTLEWIELFNNSADSTSLGLCRLQIGTTQVALTGTLQSNQYMVICRKLSGDATGPGFESIWGNNSGVWGDDPSENYPQPFVADFSLSNSAGSVELVRINQVVSTLSWTSAGADGVSWERVYPDSSQISPSRDFSGATPGFINSLTPVPHDLTIDTIVVAAQGGSTDLTITVENIGLNELTNRSLLLYYYNEANPGNETDAITTLNIPILDPGYKTDLPVTLNLDGVYRHIGLALQDDDRNRNNRRNLTVPGAAFPPVKLSELMPNPAPPLTTEWIELENPGNAAWDIQGWKLCDANACHVISSASLLVPLDSFLVLAADSAAFDRFYLNFLGPLFQPAGWLTLNNDSDQVILVDSFGYVADQFSYNSVYSGNYTWARENSGHGNWGRSADPGGTPGRTNSVVFEPTADHIGLKISPRVFSPDGDGRDDVTQIHLQATKASGYSLKIYDRYGRLVRVLFENQSFIHEQYTWDGRADDGSRLPIGIYICYFEASGVESVKQTVVIAR